MVIFYDIFLSFCFHLRNENNKNEKSKHSVPSWKNYDRKSMKNYMLCVSLTWLGSCCEKNESFLPAVSGMDFYFFGRIVTIFPCIVHSVMIFTHYGLEIGV